MLIVGGWKALASSLFFSASTKPSCQVLNFDSMSCRTSMSECSRCVTLGLVGYLIPGMGFSQLFGMTQGALQSPVDLFLEWNRRRFISLVCLGWMSDCCNCLNELDAFTNGTTRWCPVPSNPMKKTKCSLLFFATGGGTFLPAFRLLDVPTPRALPSSGVMRLIALPNSCGDERAKPVLSLLSARNPVPSSTRENSTDDARHEIASAATNTITFGRGLGRFIP
mmetsp:Transcript_6402/g.18867  ORF Transcript_6402/g.18867 Transcript_6402/m.18867 type:complete len:223 (+) Transcript_6402:722-1390(+)